MHMLDNHFRCDICIKRNKVIWCNTAQDLVRHIENTHFVCHYPECSSDNFIAFATYDELRRHLYEVHGERTTKERPPKVVLQEDDEDHRDQIISLNNRFMNKLRIVFDDESIIDKLKTQATLLIQNKISVRQFYEQFSEIAGDKKNAIFTDMVAILPDPKKRGELLRMHENMCTVPKNCIPKSESLPNVGHKQKRRQKKMVISFC
ncbi:Zinc finger, C2H2 type family protein [Histomonas meleagridis]|uniref:zinc finger protein, C2H2 type family protein n=1 Tax=Histomonas meleagridis TaxID=135588 RepID=UPI00355ACCBB|nr:Zinc finger, C2H2 type family protein [Histomonas meleagridis]KAH0800990.1 zinc finger protein, C2H2 type family protein [Histomonas meleagridis]